MIKRLSNFVLKISKRRIFLFSVAAFIVIEIFFSVSLPPLTELTDGKGLLDMSIGYSADFAYEHLSSYQKAPTEYFRIRLADSFFPAVYAVMLSILSVFVYRKKYSEVDNYRWILCIPFIAAFFDYIENIILTVLFIQLPARFDSVPSVLNVVTILKFGFLALSILLILTGTLSLLKGTDSGFLTGNTFKGKK